MNLIEAFFEIITQIVKGIFNLLQVIFGADPEFRKGKYSANFMSFWDRIRLVSSWNKGVCINGKKRLKVSKSLEHTLVIGGSGTGKTSTVIIPSIMRSNASFVCTDVDGNIFKKTSGYLTKKGFDIQVLNLQNISKSCFFNPLAYCNNDSDLKQLSELLIATAYPNQKNSDNAYWNFGGQSIIYILLRLLKYQPQEYQNLSNLRSLLQRYHSLENFIAENASESVFSDYLGFSSADQKIQSGMVSSALVALDKLADQGIGFLTSKNTLDFSKLVKGKRSALFIIVPEAKLGFYSFLLSIFYTQLFEFIQNNKPKKKNPLFIYLDEFSQLTIPDFPLHATTLRRYNTALVMLIQDLNQISQKYGIDGASAIYNGSSANKIIFPGMSLDLAQRLSNSFGRKGVAIQQQDKPYLSDRELLTVQELIQLKDKKAVFIYRNKPPLILKMRPYFKQFSLRWKSRLKPLKLEQHTITTPSLLSFKITPPTDEE